MAKSITQRQIDFLKSNLAGKLGSQKSDELPVVEGILKEYAEAFLTEAIENLNKTNSVASGLTSSDLAFEFTKTGTSYILTVGYPSKSKASKYYDFINKGVAGVGKSIDSPYAFKSKNPSPDHVRAIEKWLSTGKAKITARDVTRYGPTKQESKFFRAAASKESIAYAIAKSSKIKGIQATRFFDDAIASVFNKNFISIISKALAADVSLEIKQTFKKN